MSKLAVLDLTPSTLEVANEKVIVGGDTTISGVVQTGAFADFFQNVNGNNADGFDIDTIVNETTFNSLFNIVV